MQSAADSQKIPAQLSWAAINQAGRNYGAPEVDAESFAIEYDQNPVLKSLVKSYDQQGLVVNTQSAAADISSKEPSAKSSSMSSAAKKAAKRAIKK